MSIDNFMTYLLCFGISVGGLAIVIYPWAALEHKKKTERIGHNNGD